MKRDKDNPFKEFEAMLAQQRFEREQSSYTFQNSLGSMIYNELTELNLLEVDLHDVIQRNVFKGIDYYSIVNVAPVWMRDAGHSQEGNWTKEDLERLVTKHNNELTHKFLYYHDCEMLMNAFQNRTAVLNIMLNRVFETLTPELKYSMPEYDDVIYSCGDSSSDVYVNLNSIIITLASSFDILTKVAYELQEMSKVNFDIYPKMKSANVTFGQKVYLDDALRQTETIFAETTPTCVLKIESLRNEIIHNGSLDSHYNLYHGAKDGEIEHWIFAPAFNESGTLVTLKGRKKFYSDYRNTFNSMLPKLILDSIKLLQNTIQMLILKFDCLETDNPYDIMNYQREIAQWAGLNFDDNGHLSLPEWLIKFASNDYDS